MAFIRPKNADPALYLRWLFQKTETDLIDEIFRKRGKGYVDYAEVAALERIQNDLQSMVNECYTYVPKLIEKRFYGTNKDISGYANAKITSPTDRIMMDTLADNLLGEIIAAAAKATVTASNLYAIARLDADLFRTAALSNVAYAEALGKSAYTSAEMMEQSIRNHGVTSFIDKAGRHWSLTDYCTMASRTTARQAEVAGVLSKDEHDLYQIVKIGSTCPICAPLEGRVYSKSGMNPNYPPLALAFGKIDPAGGNDLSNTYLNIHPNCLHSIVQFTEMGKSPKQLERIREFSSPETNPLDHDPRSKRQIKEYREKERRRAQLLADNRQYEAYKAVLGNKVPKTLYDFRNIKYNNAAKWDSLKQLYRDRFHLQNQLPYVLNGETLFIPEKSLMKSVRTIAGNGSKTTLRDAQRLADTYGGEKDAWKKRTGKVESDKYVFDVHWYELDGVQYEPKLKYRKGKT